MEIDGRRIAKAYDGVTTIWDLGFTISHGMARDSAVRSSRFNRQSSSILHQFEDSNAVYYYHFDGLGSVVALTDAAGDTVQLYEYSVYGQVAASDPNHTNPFLFTGRRLDAQTGRHHYSHFGQLRIAVIVFAVVLSSW